MNKYLINSTTSLGSIDANIMIDDINTQINTGNHYFFDGYSDLATSADTKVWVFETDAKEYHLRYNLTSNKETTYTIYEDGLYTGGTAATSLNSDRNSSNTSNATLLTVTSATYDVSAASTLISSHFGANQEGKFTGGNVNSKMILKKNSIYVMVTESNASDNILDYRFEWVEK